MAKAKENYYVAMKDGGSYCIGVGSLFGLPEGASPTLVGFLPFASAETAAEYTTKDYVVYKLVPVTPRHKRKGGKRKSK